MNPASASTQPASDQLSKRQIALAALFLLGGDTKFVELEDVAVKANELGPGLFTWRKHTHQIDKQIVRVSLSDAKKKQCGAHVRKGDRDDWMLTDAGSHYARALAAQLDPGGQRGQRLSGADKRWRSRERVRILGTSAYTKAAAGLGSAISPREAEEFFRLTPYVVGERRVTKVQKLINTFTRDAEIGAALSIVVERLPER